MIDCHAHVIDPQRFPFGQGTYRPHPGESGTIEQYLALLDAHGIGQAVLVQPTSGYDRDHACLLHALDAGQGRLRGVARILGDRGADDRARPDEVLLSHPQIVGVRLDLTQGGVAVSRTAGFAWLLAELRERSQVLQVQGEGDQLAAVLPRLRRAGVRIVVDHCGRPDPERGLAQPGFAAVLELGREGHFVKLSGAFRFSHQPDPHEDVDPFIAALLASFTPHRCV